MRPHDSRFAHYLLSWRTVFLSLKQPVSMITATEPMTDDSTEAFLSTNAEVMLADGNWHSLAGLTPQQLSELQWEQEQRFAKAIESMPKHSRERSLVTGQAYDTICTILAAQRSQDQPLVMGLDKRYTRLVLDLLN